MTPQCARDTAGSATSPAICCPSAVGLPVAATVCAAAALQIAANPNAKTSRRIIREV
jgi:hypothetical protein